MLMVEAHCGHYFIITAVAVGVVLLARWIVARIKEVMDKWPFM